MDSSAEGCDFQVLVGDRVCGGIVLLWCARQNRSSLLYYMYLAFGDERGRLGTRGSVTIQQATKVTQRLLLGGYFIARPRRKKERKETRSLVPRGRN